MLNHCFVNVQILVAQKIICECNKGGTPIFLLIVTADWSGMKIAVANVYKQ